MIIKIDMENSFDRLGHNFIFVILSWFWFEEEILS
jgi:hypothetical protein